MDHRIEYLHTLVEHEFTRDQYKVSYEDGKYYVMITIPDNGKNPMTYFVYMMYQKKMEKCLHGFIKPGNLKLSVDLPIKLIKHNLEGHARLNRLHRVDTPTNN